MNNDMVKNNTIEQLLRDGWVVLAGDLKKQRSVYKITGRGMQRYATLVVALYGEDEKHITKKSMLGGPKLSKLTADNWPDAEYEAVVQDLANNGMLTQSVDGLELSEKGMSYVKTMFDIEGKPKSDPLKEAVGGKTVSGKGDDKVAGYLLKAVTFMGKIADGGAKMDRMLNGGGSTKKTKGSTKKTKGKNNVPRPKRQPTINNNYYQFNAKPKPKTKKKPKTQKKQEKKSDDFNFNFGSDNSEFYKIG